MALSRILAEPDQSFVVQTTLVLLLVFGGVHGAVRCLDVSVGIMPHGERLEMSSESCFGRPSQAPVLYYELQPDR